MYSDQLLAKNEPDGDLRISASRFSNLRELADVSLTKVETEAE